MATTKQLLSDLVSGVSSVPSNYIRPISDRPNIDEVSLGNPIPLIDLQGLDGSNRSDVVKEIGQACQEYGFFQVKNHGIPEEVIDKMLCLSRDFFHLPESERMKNYSDDPMKTTRLSTSFNVKTEKVSNWRDFLRIHCHPLEDYIHEWPTNPPSFQDVAEYSKKARGLALRLLEAISESLGLERDYINKALGKHGQHMAINYYPSMSATRAYLRVLKDGKWIAVPPISNTFIVNIGDQMQVISNDRYKSVLHRAIVNSNKERISIPTFYCPSPDAVTVPAPHLINDHHPPLYRNFAYSDYYQKFWNRGLATETCLDMFKITTSNP
ncbi:hypothetical protein Patl1_00700 [Pistacia atlantica]|uniref:Uncharacterized protein n=1 Tax=Pistacia atlantica TaxID=434234 RepID=A0ACC1C5H6_9ROSI|nr:hypothetical protein Patl1_00700 [Pistacia atlantica]